jgi:glucokinase
MKSHDDMVLAIDLGGTKILSAVIDRKGSMLARDHSVTPAALGQEAVIDAIKASVERAADQIEVALSRMLAVGIGAPGPSNAEKGILFTSPNLPGWKDVPIRDIIERFFKRKAYLINDANAAALAEHRFGAGRGTKNMIYITVSTGIGGGVIVEDRLMTGAIGTAAELGHMTIDDEGPACNCGNKGCWETLASGTALDREAKSRIREGIPSIIPDLVGGDTNKISAKTVQEAAEQGDELAGKLIAKSGYYLGVGLANLLNIFNPEMIVIGGGVSNIGKRLLDPAFETARERAYTSSYEAVRFRSPTLGRNSGVIGAAAHAFDKSDNPGGRTKEDG